MTLSLTSQLRKCFTGWCDSIHGNTSNTSEDRTAITVRQLKRHFVPEFL